MAEIKCFLTKCPNCGDPTGYKARRWSTGDLVMTTVDAKMVSDVKNHNILLAPVQIPIYIKKCTKCGFLSFFEANVIERTGKL